MFKKQKLENLKKKRGKPDKSQMSTINFKNGTFLLSDCESWKAFLNRMVEVCCLLVEGSLLLSSFILSSICDFVVKTITQAFHLSRVPASLSHSKFNLKTEQTACMEWSVVKNAKKMERKEFFAIIKMSDKQCFWMRNASWHAIIFGRSLAKTRRKFGKQIRLLQNPFFKHQFSVFCLQAQTKNRDECNRRSAKMTKPYKKMPQSLYAFLTNRNYSERNVHCFN